jgi:predicted DCC family thiol-disulfide oxidoreductase YuxK
MARFHVRDATGCWQTGAWGFAELWSNLPAYRWLARTLRALRLLPLMDRVYSVFARRRVRHDCHSGICSAPVALESADSSTHSQINGPTPGRTGHGS